MGNKESGDTAEYDSGHARLQTGIRTLFALERTDSLPWDGGFIHPPFRDVHFSQKYTIPLLNAQFGSGRDFIF